MSRDVAPPSSAAPGELTLWLRRDDPGGACSADEILPLVYAELRTLAAARMAREQPGQTLQPTALVHEAWLRLGAGTPVTWQNRAHFFAAAAEAMRRILIDGARRRRAARHGGGGRKLPESAIPADAATPEADDEILLLHDALEALERHDPRKAELVKHRHFAGLEFGEIAEIMGISERTANRDWAYARTWLFNEIARVRG